MTNHAKAPGDPDCADIIAGALQTSRAHAYELMAKACRSAQDEGQPSPAELAAERRFFEQDFHEELHSPKKAQTEPQEAVPVAWANFRHDPPSYVPYRTREDAQRSVNRSEISATQEGPYSVVPLYAHPAPKPQQEKKTVPGLTEEEFRTRHQIGNRHFSDIRWAYALGVKRMGGEVSE